MRGILLAAVLGAACQPADARIAIGATQVAGEDRLIEGRVLSIDVAPRTYDGDGLIVVKLERRRRVTIHVPSGERPCAARGLDLLEHLRAGDVVRAKGRSLRTDAISVCEVGTFLERR